MNPRKMSLLFSLIVLGASLYMGLGPSVTHANRGSEVPAGKPEAAIDLASASGVDLIKGNWRYSDTKIVEVDFRGPGELGDKHKAIIRYEVQPDGTLKNGKLFFDFTDAPGDDGLDGIKVDQKGNLYVSAPGGLWVISPEGKHLGTIVTPRHAHNMAWGDADGKTLYLCSRSGLYRIRLNIAGVRPS